MARMLVGDYSNACFVRSICRRLLTNTGRWRCRSRRVRAFADGIVGAVRMTWRIQSFEMNGNKYFSSSKGVIKSTSASADLEPAGLPRALDMSYTVAAGTIFTASGQYRAYRHTWANKDANNNLVVGDRSGRVIALSTGANQNATLTIRIPPQITTSHVYQVFATSISTSDPGDEMVQIFEANPTTAQITAGTISYEDKIPDAFRNVGVPLYTNTSQEGGANGHTRHRSLARSVSSAVTLSTATIPIRTG